MQKFLKAITYILILTGIVSVIRGILHGNDIFTLIGLSIIFLTLGISVINFGKTR